MGHQPCVYGIGNPCSGLGAHDGTAGKIYIQLAGGGVIQDTASSASLCALLAARERATTFSITRLRRQTGRLYLAQAHSSIEKGGQVAGIGRDNLR